MKGLNTNGLEWGEDKYYQYQHSGQHCEQPVASFAAQLAQAANGI
jgi:hypothetical protein